MPCWWKVFLTPNITQLEVFITRARRGCKKILALHFYIKKCPNVDSLCVTVYTAQHMNIFLLSYKFCSFFAQVERKKTRRTPGRVKRTVGTEILGKWPRYSEWMVRQTSGSLKQEERGSDTGAHWGRRKRDTLDWNSRDLAVESGADPATAIF